MKLTLRKSGNDTAFYIVKSFRKNGKPTSEVKMRCGLLSKLKEQYEDPIAHFTEVAKEMTESEKIEEKVLVSKIHLSEKVGDEEILLDGGYLFLRKIYRGLGLNKMCDDFKKRHHFQFDFDDILEKLVFSRMLKPASKMSTYEDSFSFIEKPNFELHDIYRALSVLNNCCDEIQAGVYKNSNFLVKRDTRVLYFDCTNFFFEVESEDEFRRYGVSKEHRPNPIVQMGLFMDGNGFPLAFDLHPGNTNEQIMLRPLEERIIKDFALSKMIVCTDAGLASYSNREFNDIKGRAFIVTQSIKKLKSHLKEWALSREGMKSLSGEMTYKDGTPSDDGIVKYKSRYIKEEMDVDTPVGKIKVTNEWRLIVTYSKSYATYQKKLRAAQANRAKQLIDNPSSFNKVSSTDCKRFVKNLRYTKDGEIAKKTALVFDQDRFDEEEKYDGFYALMTNLEGNAKEIVAINHKRWKIEESFRIMKTNLKARPTYVSLKEHITAHFLTCYLALLIMRILESKLENKYTVVEILGALQKLRYTKTDAGYIAAFKHSLVIDDLEKLYGMDVQYKGYTVEGMRKLINISKRH